MRLWSRDDPTLFIIPASEGEANLHSSNRVRKQTPDLMGALIYKNRIAHFRKPTLSSK